MIWIILLIIGLITTLFLVTPLLGDKEKTTIKPLPLSLFMAGFIALSLGLYAWLGTPTPPRMESIIEQASPTPEIGQADIQAMVEGLASRLADDPENPEGWARLIRSRIVMRDIPKLINDHTAMTKHYAGRDDIIAQINQQSGFNEFAAALNAYLKEEEAP